MMRYNDKMLQWQNNTTHDKHCEQSFKILNFVLTLIKYFINLLFTLTKLSYRASYQTKDDKFHEQQEE